MHAFDFNVSFFALMLMNGVVNLATTLPSAPGYIGTFDGPGIAVLTLYGVDPAVATAYTLTLDVYKRQAAGGASVRRPPAREPASSRRRG